MTIFQMLKYSSQNTFKKLRLRHGQTTLKDLDL